MTRRPSSRRLLCVAAIVAATGSSGAFGAPNADLSLGDPSVQSQRGQRLKLALPYGSAPGAPVSVTRFEVVSVRAPDGWASPSPDGFTIAKPARRNLVYLQSAEPVEAPEITLAVRVAGQEDSLQTWRLAVPPQSTTMATPVSGAASRALVPGSRPAARGPAKRRTTPGR